MVTEPLFYVARLTRPNPVPGQPRIEVARMQLQYGASGEVLKEIHVPTLEPTGPASVVELSRQVYRYDGEWYILLPGDPTVCVYELVPGPAQTG